MKHPAFDIGQWVRVKATVSFPVDYTTNRKDVKRHERPPFLARIVGARYRCIGNRVGGSSSSGFDGYDYTPGYLNVEKKIIVWLVSLGFTNSPIEALEEDIEKVDDVNLKFEWQQRKYYPWSQAAREEQSKLAKSTPRENGKFAKAKR